MNQSVGLSGKKAAFGGWPLPGANARHYKSAPRYTFPSAHLRINCGFARIPYVKSYKERAQEKKKIAPPKEGEKVPVWGKKRRGPGGLQAGAAVKGAAARGALGRAFQGPRRGIAPAGHILNDLLLQRKQARHIPVEFQYIFRTCSE